MPVARGILDLFADLPERLALPCHPDRREVPLRVARHAGGFEVRGLVACTAARCAALRGGFTRSMPACLMALRTVAEHAVTLHLRANSRVISSIDACGISRVSLASSARCSGVSVGGRPPRLGLSFIGHLATSAIVQAVACEVLISATPSERSFRVGAAY
jgi:hypothetical protein